ncbi:sugar ABC transporter permease [Acholeplasma manati]|uniref:Sugar ABC transporter permease n=1 Tax=Paracholeplasma manati TaxID=591373 RepID=A0ABT2Y6B4_9MOLU|nr:sugar ABC transporter permease [Paracholeplasma manati]MCV2231525.1 sugar ABC transporter permease [Paracholeplasma manati]
MDKPRYSLGYKIAHSDKLSALVFVGPYYVLFSIFIIIAVLAAVLLSFTYFNTIEFPTMSGLKNYVDIVTTDNTFMQVILPNTIKFALIVGPGGYLLSFILAWSLAQLPHKLRTVLAIIFYSPSMTMGVAMVVVWSAVFSGDQAGYLNHFMLQMNLIAEPVQWLQSPQHLMNIMIIVSLWGSMGVGFLAMLSGILNVDKEIFEAAYMDGISNKFQEIFFITIPLMKPQMLFGAVMMIVSTFQAGAIGVQLSGSNPTPQNAGQLILNHIEDFGFIRFEMGYAAALSVILLILVALISKVAKTYLTEKE